MNTIEQAAAQSTCLKRTIVCEIYDVAGNLLSCESNRCQPPDGKCCRLEVVSVKDGYPEHSTCNWTHAEEMALKSLPENSHPYQAIIYGHSFPCPSCEKKLTDAGVKSIDILEHPATGLRRVNEGI